MILCIMERCETTAIATASATEIVEDFLLADSTWAASATSHTLETVTKNVL